VPALAIFSSGKYLHIFWDLGGVAAVLAATSSLKAIRTASSVTAFPLMFLLLVVYATLGRRFSSAV
jgi:choline-glycine betaine transporter